MILPTKYLTSERSLIKIGADILKLLSEPKTVSRLWDDLKQLNNHSALIKYEWFVLALDFLYIINVVTFERDKVWRVSYDSPNL